MLNCPKHRHGICVHKTLHDINSNPTPRLITTAVDKGSKDEFEALKKAFSTKLSLFQHYFTLAVETCLTHKKTAELLECISPPPRNFKIYFNYNCGSNLEVLNSLAKILSWEGCVIDLNISIFRLLEKPAIRLLEIIKNNTTLRRLDLPPIDYDPKFFNEALSGLLTTNTTLTDLEYLNATGAAKDFSFCLALPLNTSIKKLNFNGTEFLENGTKNLADGLSYNSSLEHLELISCDIRHGVREIFKSLIYNQSLTFLDLSNNYIVEDGLVTFEEMMRHNTSLSSLKLNNNAFGYEATKLLASPIAQSYGNITYLSLSRCKLKDNVTLVISALSTNTIIEYIDLSHNEIGYSGAVVVGQMMKKNNTLRTLILNDNRVSNEGIVAISEGMEQNSAIQNLALRRTLWCMPTDGMLNDAFKRMLRIDSSLLTLDMDENGGVPQSLLDVISNTIQTNGTILRIMLQFHYGNDSKDFESILRRNAHNITMKNNSLFNILLKESSNLPSISFNTNKRIY